MVEEEYDEEAENLLNQQKPIMTQVKKEVPKGQGTLGTFFKKQ